MVEGNPCHGYLSIRAVDLLTSLVGLQEVARFFSTAAPSATSWDIHFATSFGISTREFYRLFDEHRDAGFPKLVVPLERPKWR